MYRVMVVDDEVYVRDLLVKNLSKSGLEIEIVAVASDGREALEQAFVLKPDIVLTDIAMSFMDGLELIAELQKAGLQCKTAVISGYDDLSGSQRLSVKTLSSQRVGIGGSENNTGTGRTESPPAESVSTERTGKQPGSFGQRKNAERSVGRPQRRGGKRRRVSGGRT